MNMIKFGICALSVSALALAACGDKNGKAPALDDAVSDAASKVEKMADKASDTVKDAMSEQLCTAFGPQTPRDISQVSGKNMADFAMADNLADLNLCNIHTHTNAEHKGPGFSVFAGDSKYGGYQCNETASLTPAQLKPVEGAYGKVKPGDTIEVHWVHSSCDVAPGEGLGACLTDTCTDPLLRVEAQTFLLVNDSSALDFGLMNAGDHKREGKYQATYIPNDTGTPVMFRGSTTGPSYTQSTCSPAKVTWNVRPQCAMLDINSLHKWAAEGNVFKEDHSHGVRKLVTAPELLSPIK